MPGARLISIRSDATSLARVNPVDLAIVADPKAVYWSEVTTNGGSSGTIWKLAK